MSGKFITGKNGTVEDVILNAPAEPVGGTLGASAHDHGNCALCDWQEERIRQLERELGELKADFDEQLRRTTKAEREVAELREKVRIAESWAEIDAALAARQEERKEGK